MKTKRRGYLPEYDDQFGAHGVQRLKEAAIDALFLLNRGYDTRRASHIAMEHYQLSEMQRVALSRGLDPDQTVARRSQTRVTPSQLAGQTVYIDGFNAVILMESLVSESPVFRCLDGAIRDLANLKGSYHIIDKTEPAIRLVFAQLDKLQIAKAIINIDSPVSNSRNLKVLLLCLAKDYNVEIEVNLIDACDKSFYNQNNVITGDCIVIDNAKSWVPLYSWIVDDRKLTHNVWLIDFSQMNLKV